MPVLQTEPENIAGKKIKKYKITCKKLNIALPFVAITDILYV
jgi:hypothetical protein